MLEDSGASADGGAAATLSADDAPAAEGGARGCGRRRRRQRGGSGGGGWRWSRGRGGGGARGLGADDAGGHGGGRRRRDGAVAVSLGAPGAGGTPPREEARPGGPGDRGVTVSHSGRIFPSAFGDTALPFSPPPNAAGRHGWGGGGGGSGGGSCGSGGGGCSPTAASRWPGLGIRAAGLSLSVPAAARIWARSPRSDGRFDVRAYLCARADGGNGACYLIVYVGWAVGSDGIDGRKR